MEYPKLTFEETMIILYSEEVLHISNRSMVRSTGLCHLNVNMSHECEPKY